MIPSLPRATANLILHSTQWVTCRNRAKMSTVWLIFIQQRNTDKCLTCPGWRWRSWPFWPSWRVWSPARSHGYSAAQDRPEGHTAAVKRGTSVRHHVKVMTVTSYCTFCLLSSLGKWITNIPSLRELTEIPVWRKNKHAYWENKTRMNSSVDWSKKQHNALFFAAFSWAKFSCVRETVIQKSHLLFGFKINHYPQEKVFLSKKLFHQTEDWKAVKTNMTSSLRYVYTERGQ